MRALPTVAASALHVVEGVGGGVSSGIQMQASRQVLACLPASRTAADSPVADVLLDLGVYALSRSKREALATKLVGLGITGPDLFSVRDYLAENISDETVARRTVVARVIDADTLGEAVADLRRRHERLTTQSAPSRSTEHYWGFPSPHPSCACEGCEGRRRMGYAEVRS